MAENLEGGGIDLIWRRFLLAIELILKSDMNVYLALTCEAGVWGPHISKNLDNRPHGVLNHMVLCLTSSG